jgi:peptidoglycan/LPS O-acetylase OafA/YrhL
MAGLVVIEHARDLIFRDAPQLPKLTVSWKAFYFVTGLGHAAVVVFFVLSGFFVGGKLLKTSKLDTNEIQHYLIDRFSRIYVVLVPALLLTVILDTSGGALSKIYTSYDWSSSMSGPAAALNSENFLASLFNVTMYIGAPLGSNGPLWSLAFEWVIYLVFPWLLSDMHKLRIEGPQRGMIIRLAIFALLIAGAPNLIQWLIIWLLGAAARWRLERYNGQGRLITVLGLFVSLFVMFVLERIHLHFLANWVTDLMLGISVAALCAHPMVICWRRAASINSTIAGFSFSLYVVHYPTIMFSIAALQSHGLLTERLVPGGDAFGYFLCVVTVAYLVAWLFSYVTEAQTHRVRRALLMLPAACKISKPV